ncbi:MAG TPA: hypothetical protein VFK05_27450 [Polyangiaceae bacterium]|nr:hypothetical protein [Polyangiaceae bacterium]
MRSFRVVFVSTLFPFALLTLATQSALAQEPDAEAAPEAAPPPPPPGAPPGAVLVPTEKPDEPHPFTLLFNPIGLFVGRYSIQAEYQPVLHHAITLNPFYDHTSVKVTTNGVEEDIGSVSGGGAELGYRYYTGRKGPNGFFVGPSFLFAAYTQTQTGVPDLSFTSFGAAVDVGGQAVIGSGFVIGGGFGMQWTKNSKDINTDNYNFTSALIAGDGVRPRFLFSLGYAF